MKINNQDINIETISFMELNDIVGKSENIKELENIIDEIYEYKTKAVTDFNYHKATLYRDFQNLLITRINIIKYKKE